jgi:hypothetical protein
MAVRTLNIRFGALRPTASSIGVRSGMREVAVGDNANGKFERAWQIITARRIVSAAAE